MPYTLELPDIGEGVVEAEVQQWFVEEGQVVGEDQPLVEVMTDKATVTIPSPRRGRILKRFWKVGDVAKVHAPLVELELEAGAGAPEARAGTIPSEPVRAERGAGEAGAESRHAQELPRERRHEGAASIAANLPHPVPAGPPRKALATPAVRALARELAVDIDAVQDTGPGGRVTKDDLRSFRQGVNGHAPRRDLRVVEPAAEAARRFPCGAHGRASMTSRARPR